MALLTLATCLGLCASPVSAAQVDQYWNAGIGDWSTAGNWNPAGVPFYSVGTDWTYAHINNGGEAQISNAAGAYWLDLGEGAGESGALTLDGSSAELTVHNLRVGVDGTGTVTVRNGATLGNSDPIHYTALFTAAGSSLTVDGNNSRLISGYTSVYGATLDVTNGATASLGNLKLFGPSTMTLDGNGTDVTADRIELGTSSGNSILDIRNGATFSTASGIGDMIGGTGTGTVNVDGSGSSWTSNGDRFFVGASSDGNLNISNGGSVRITTGFTTIGRSASATGTVTVDGSGSLLSTAQSLFLGSCPTAVDFLCPSEASTGTLTLSNGGTVNIDNGNGTLYVGANNGSSGTLNIGAASGDTAQSAGNLNASTIAFGDGTATLVFNHTDLGYTFSPDISGAGSVNVESGTTILTGNNSYSGGTTIDNGTLAVNGSITSATTVNNGGTLGGSGAVGSVTVNSGGTLAPGNSIGTLNANNVDFSAGGVYQVEVDDAGNSDRLNVTGTATLTGGSVQVTPASGTYADSTDYTILTAGTINGTFGSVSSSLAFLDPTLSYDANNVYLNLTRNNVSYGAVAGTPNQLAVGNTLTRIASAGPSSDMQPLLNAINTLTVSGAQQAYDSLSGVQHSGTQSLLLGANGRFTGLLNARSHSLAAHPGAAANQAAAFPPVRLAYNGDLADLQLASNGSTTGLMESEGSGFWLTPQGGSGNIEDTVNASGLNYTWYGLFGGADRWIDNHRLVGVALGASHSDADPAAGKTTIDSLELAAYGRWQSDTRYLDASLNVGQHRTDTSRRVVVGTLSRTASADYDAQSLGLALETGHTVFKQGEQRVIPFVGLRYAGLSRDGFSESGAGSANLTIDGETQQSLQGRLGVRTEQHSESASGRRLDWDVSLAWAREFMDNTGTLKAGFEGAPSTTFSIDGPALDRNRVQLAVGLTADLSQHTSLRIGYDGELAGSDQSHTASANFRIAW